jgi:hypothetical protein
MYDLDLRDSRDRVIAEVMPQSVAQLAQRYRIDPRLSVGDPPDCEA